MTFSDGTPSTVSEMLARERRIAAIMADWNQRRAAGRVPGLGEPHQVITQDREAHDAMVGRLRALPGFTALRADIEADRTPCPDCGGGYWQEYIGPPPSDQYIVHASICPAVVS